MTNMPTPSNPPGIQRSSGKAPVPVAQPTDTVDPSLTDYDMDVVQAGDEIRFVYEGAGIDETGVVQLIDRTGSMWRFHIADDDRDFDDTLNFPKDRLGDDSYTVELLDWPGRDD